MIPVFVRDYGVQKTVHLAAEKVHGSGDSAHNGMSRFLAVPFP
jgi:hypothetical protein